jgi:hypothetical protein
VYRRIIGSVTKEDPGDVEANTPRLDYHDPTAGIGGSPPAASALTLRVWLASGALAVCVAGVVLSAVVGGPAVLVALLAVVAVTAIVDLIVIARRRRQENGA